MTVAEVLFYIFISLFAATGGAYVYIIVRDVVYALLFQEDNSNETKDIKTEKPKIKTVTICDECSRCKKESVCRYSSEYIKVARKIGRAITCETANITLKCEEFLAKPSPFESDITNHEHENNIEVTNND